MVASRRPQLDKMGTSRQKPAPMSRTSGTAKRKSTTSASEIIGRQRQAASGNAGPRDKFNPAVAQGVVDNFGIGVGADGKFQVNPAVLALNLVPVGRVVGPLSKVAKVAKVLTPVGTRVAGAAGRIASGARRANAGRADVLAAARARAAAATDGIGRAGMEAYDSFAALERRVGTASAEALSGSARATRQRAMDSAGRVADSAAVLENKARNAAARTARLADYEFAAREVASRLKNVRRIKKLRNKGKTAK